MVVLVNTDKQDVSPILKVYFKFKFKLVYSIQIHNIISLILIYDCQTLPFERCTLKIAVPKFPKSSVDLQLKTFLENKILHKILKILKIFKKHLFEGTGLFGCSGSV